MLIMGGICRGRSIASLGFALLSLWQPGCDARAGSLSAFKAAKHFCLLAVVPMLNAFCYLRSLSTHQQQWWDLRHALVPTSGSLPGKDGCQHEANTTNKEGGAPFVECGSVTRRELAFHAPW